MDIILSVGQIIWAKPILTHGSIVSNHAILPYSTALSSSVFGSTLVQVKLEVVITMLKIFKTHEADTSILDDFNYYDEREKDLQEKRSKERDVTKNTPAAVNDTSINELADKVAESLNVDEHREVQ